MVALFVTVTENLSWSLGVIEIATVLLLQILLTLFQIAKHNLLTLHRFSLGHRHQTGNVMAYTYVFANEYLSPLRPHWHRTILKNENAIQFSHLLLKDHLQKSKAQ